MTVASPRPTIACSSPRLGCSARVASRRRGGAAYCASGPRALAKSASPIAGAAPSPSIPPRRMTRTKRLPPGPPAPANDSVDQAPSAPAAAAAPSTRRRAGSAGAADRTRRDVGAAECRFMSVLDAASAALELRREQEQGERLGAVGGALDLPRRFRAQQRAQALRAELARVDAAPGAIGDSRRPFDALPYRVGSKPVVGTIAPARRRRRRLEALAEGTDRSDRGVVRFGSLEPAVADPEQARRRDDELLGSLQLGRPGVPRRVVANQLAVDLGELAVALQVGRGQAIDERRRRIVGDEMARQLGRDEARRRRMVG